MNLNFISKEEEKELLGHWWIDDVNIINNRSSEYTFILLGIGGEYYHHRVRLNIIDRILGVDIIMKTNYEIRKLSDKIQMFRSEYFKLIERTNGR